MLIDHVVLFVVTAVLARYYKQVGWIYIARNYVLLASTILILWQFQNGWAGFNQDFNNVLANCFFALVYGLGIGAQYAKDTPKKE